MTFRKDTLLIHTRLAFAACVLLGSDSYSLPSAPTAAEAYQAILQRSLRIEAQRVEISASEARRLQAKAAFAPTLRADASELRQGDAGASSIDPMRGASLVVSANLFRSFSDVAGLKATSRNLRAQREKLLSEQQAAEDDAIETIAQWISSVQKQRINARVLELRRDLLRIARERFQRGLLPQQEVDKVSIDADSAAALLSDAVANEATARARLQALLGESEIQLEWPWSSTIRAATFDKEAATNLNVRPDWRNLELLREEAYWTREQSKRQLLPRVDFSGAYGNQNLSDAGRRDWRLLFTLSVPLFDLQRVSDLHTNSENLRAAELRSEELRRSVPAAHLATIDSFYAARNSAVEREKTALSAEKLYSDNLQRFQLGRASANDLAIDQNRLLNAQILAIEGWKLAHLNYAKACHSEGKFVSPKGDCTSFER